MKKLLLVILTVISITLVSGCNKNEKNDIEKSLDNFIKNDLKNVIVQGGYVDYYTAASIDLLNNNGYSIDIKDYIEEDIIDQYINFDYNSSTQSNAFKALVVSKSLDIDLTNAKNYFETQEAVEPYGDINFINALNILNISNDLKVQTIDNLKNSIAEWTDADTSSMTMQALQQDTPVEFYNILVSKITKDGVLGYDETPNGASTAQAIIGLLAMGKDVYDTKYSIEGVSLLDSLMTFKTDGGFKNLLNGEVDLGFTTPQGFAALACMFVFDKTNESVVLFSA